MTRLTQLTPTLWVENLETTIKFYEEKLGFSIRNKTNEWASLTRDEVEIMLAVPFPEWNFKESLFTGALYINTENVDEHWEKLKDQVTIEYPIEDFDYSMRVCYS
ncbi:MAG: VOC family protein [Chitinophagales bacterium]